MNGRPAGSGCQQESAESGKPGFSTGSRQDGSLFHGRDKKGGEKDSGYVQVGTDPGSREGKGAKDDHVAKDSAAAVREEAPGSVPGLL